MGIIFWILLLVLLIMQPFALRTASNGPPKQKRKSRRSLSEIPSQEYSNRLNKRFDQADALEEDEQRSSSRNSEESLIKRSNVNPPMKLKTKETSSTSGKITFILNYFEFPANFSRAFSFVKKVNKPPNTEMKILLLIRPSFRVLCVCFNGCFDFRMGLH